MNPSHVCSKQYVPFLDTMQRTVNFWVNDTFFCTIFLGDEKVKLNESQLILSLIAHIVSALRLLSKSYKQVYFVSK